MRRALLVLLLAACGDGGGGIVFPDAALPDAAVPDAAVADAAGPDAAPPTTVDSFCRRLSETVCTGLASCDCRFDVRAYDAEGCVDARTAECVSGLGAGVSADLASGHARFHEPGVEACLVALQGRAASCTLDLDSVAAPLPDECAAFVIADVSVGKTCQLSRGGFAFCGDDAEGFCRPDNGACTALPGKDDTCVGALYCALGLYCDGETCVAPGGPDADCQEPGACQDGLVCNTQHHCAAPAAAGSPCGDTIQCAGGLFCDAGSCAAASPLGAGCRNPDECGASRSCGRAPETRTCGPRDGAGDPCENDSCAAGATCSGGVCVELPGDGEECLDGFSCAAGFTCVDGMGICAPLPRAGETCASGNRFCADGLGCDFSDNTCQPGRGAGEECLINPPDYLCAAGLGCDFTPEGSICVPIGNSGDACTNDRICGPGTYCELSTLVCTDRLADGEPCNDDNECRPGSECEVLPGGPVCAPIPTSGQPCFDACSGDLACKGPGGQCVAELCVLP